MLNTVTPREMYLSRNTVIEMLRDRGYDVAQETCGSLEEYLTNFKDEKVNINFTAHKNNQKFIAVIFTTDAKLNKKAIEMLLTEYTNKSISNIIIVSNTKLNHASVAFINNASINVEVFLYKELMFNPTKHVLVPKQSILEEPEKQQFLDKFRCKLEDLPIMMKTDVIARYLGGWVDDVVKIVRKSKTAGESLYYRVIR